MAQTSNQVTWWRVHSGLGLLRARTKKLMLCIRDMGRSHALACPWLEAPSKLMLSGVSKVSISALGTVRSTARGSTLCRRKVRCPKHL